MRIDIDLSRLSRGIELRASHKSGRHLYRIRIHPVLPRWFEALDPRWGRRARRHRGRRRRGRRIRHLETDRTGKTLNWQEENKE